MSPDDSDPDHAEERDAERSEAADAEDVADGQPRDPETGQFLSKDQRDSAGADEADDEPAPTDPDQSADEVQPDTTSGRQTAPVEDRTERDARPERDRQQLRFSGPATVKPPAREGAPALRITAGASGDVVGGAPAGRHHSGSQPVFPPSLHLVPMQVEQTGELVHLESDVTPGRLSGRR